MSASGSTTVSQVQTASTSFPLVQDATANASITASPDSPITLAVGIDLSNVNVEGIPTARATVSPTNLSRVKNAAISLLPTVNTGSITTAASLAASSFGFGASLPPAAQRITDLDTPTNITMQFPGSGAEQLETFRKTRQFPNPGIVIPGNSPDAVYGEIPNLKFDVSVTAQTPSRDFGTARMQIELPPERFITFREFQGCGEEYPSIDSNLSRAEQAIQSMSSTIQQRAQRVEEQANRLARVVPADIGSLSIERPDVGSQARSLLADGGGSFTQAITEDLLREVDSKTLGEIEAELSSIPDSQPEPGFSDIRQDVRAAEAIFGNVTEDRCLRQFQNRADAIMAATNAAEEVFNQYTQTQDRLLDLLGRVEGELPPCAQQFQELSSRINNLTSGSLSEGKIQDARELITRLENGEIAANRPGCREEFISRLERALSEATPGDRAEQAVQCAQEISQSLRNRISGFETEVNNLSGIVSENRRSELVREGQQLIRDIRAEDMPEECKSQFVSRVRSSLQRVRQKRTISDIDCSSSYSGIARDIQSLRNDAAGLTTSNPQEIEQIVSKGQDLLNRIQSNVDEAECKREFANSVRGILSRVREQNVRVNVTVGEVRSSVEQRQQEIQRLQQQVNQFIEEVNLNQGFGSQ